MTSANWLTLGTFVLGIVGRVFVPWLLARAKAPEAETSKWNWRYVWPQLVMIVVLGAISPMIADVETLFDAGAVVAYTSGWGAADFGKTIFLDGVAVARK